MHHVGIVYDEIYAAHDTGQHPECRDRVLGTIERLKSCDFYGETALPQFHAISPTPATPDQIRWAHNGDLLSRVHDTVVHLGKNHARANLDGDTVVSARSEDAAYLAAGGNFAAIDAIMSGTIQRSFTLCRPPGHHSNVQAARGFCVFNNIILTAEYLARQYGIKKIFIFDWDAHAGNGSEEILDARPPTADICFMSMHQHPRTLYPGTCFAEDIGEGRQKGKTFNFTLAPGSGQEVIEQCFKDIILPVVHSFKPEFFLVSAGFDAHHEDPLTNLGFQETSYSWMTQQLTQLADHYAQGRLACTLEGGYNIDRLSNSVANVVANLADRPSVATDDEFNQYPKTLEFANDTLLPTLRSELGKYWNVIK